MCYIVFLLLGCGGILHNNEGSITSPNFPNEYPNNAECIWEIRVADGYHIGLVFVERFHLEDRNNCDKDYVEVSFIIKIQK